MESHRFDAFTALLTQQVRRRLAVTVLAGCVFGLPGAMTAVAAKNQAKRRRRRRRRELRRRCLEACGSEQNCKFCLHHVGGGIGCAAAFMTSCQECTGEMELECGLFAGCVTASQPVGGARKTTLCGGQFATGVCVQPDFCT